MITQLDPKTALVLIDLQKGIAALPVAHPAADIVAKSAELIAAFRNKKLPVVIVNVNPLGAKWTQTRVEESTAPKGEDAIAQARAAMEQGGFFDIVPELPVDPNDIYITKTSWSAFYNTELEDKLKALNITSIVLAGIATSIGVEGTARDASRLGYNITFAADAMTDVHLSAHEHSLKLIFPRVGEVDTTAAIIKKLSELTLVTDIH
ncbi:Nicotinamidase-related amidase [Pedobacter westerhofensis]|uniref:Nicotinamidase-related amidase n=1 Tax=Pedobacter westerhofensis TaxID=425512 RepID=A0A521B0G2_9SPHI|nr:isochorismatase family protein [Pedobacter westerhofensis]SMO40260.1 Nicotinamidase-related amidase [Pedobacter westerhofensis]